MADTLKDNARRVFWFNDNKTPNVYDALEKKMRLLHINSILIP